jgi:hypothetical protein
MPCFYPLDAYWAKEANLDTGRTPILFTRNGSSGDHLQVPCGKCAGCRSDQSYAWAVRMYCESQLWERNSFLTLTYDEENYPADGKLCKEHVTSFIKRLRNFYKFRYFWAGEYGEQTHRAHYHLAVFGEDFLSGSFPVDNGQGYSHPRVEDEWQKGNVFIGSMTMSSACYIAGYCVKKMGDPDTCSSMSLKPGLGHDWIKEHYDDVRRAGSIIVEGKEVPVPKRFLIWAENELKEVIKERRDRFKNMTPDEIWRRRESLANKEKNLKSRLKRKEEKI